MKQGLIVIENAISKKVPCLGCGLLLLSLLACRYFPFAPNLAATLSPVPGLDELRFNDPETGKRFRDLNTAINSLVDETWRTNPYHLSGNFYETAWCRGVGANLDCEWSDTIFDRRDQQRISLNTLFYDQNLPEVFGLGLHADWVPKVTGWGASFDFAEGGRSVVGNGWQVTFREYLAPTGSPEATITLGWTDSYEIYETQIQYYPSQSIRADLALYLAGPQAMRDGGLAKMKEFAQQIKTEITSHQISACDKEPYQGNGIPPVCKPRPMTAAEEDTELARAEKVFVEQEQLLGDHYQEMYAAWMSAFPLDKFWK